MLVSAPELLIACFKMRKPLKQCDTLYDLNCFASIWACIENILLAMSAEGLYGVTYVPNGTTSLKEVLGVPEDYEIAALIPIGYPKDHFVDQKAVSLSQKIHVDNW
jgi:nitroreductase